MVIGQDIANQRKELEEKYEEFHEELHKKLESELNSEAEKFHQTKVETADKVIVFRRDQEEFAKEQEEQFEKAKKDIADKIQEEVNAFAVCTRETLEKELTER